MGSDMILTVKRDTETEARIFVEDRRKMQGGPARELPSNLFKRKLRFLRRNT